MIALSDRIEYLPASEEPLSADVVFIHGDRYEWIFDVGNNEESRKIIEGIKKPKKVVLSHFHADHSGNLTKIGFEEVFLGNFAAKKYGFGTVVSKKVCFEDGVKITLFPLPSSHSKGSLGLMAGEGYAFLGDGTYTALQTKILEDGSCRKLPAYNVSELKQAIDVLKALPAAKFCVSHSEPFVKNRESVLSELNEVWKKREKGESFVFVE